MGIIGIRGLKRSAFALVAVLPISCGQITVQPTAADVQADEGELGTLSLTSEAFPEGAETLVMNISRVDIAPKPCGLAKSEATSVAVSSGDGLGLSALPDRARCRLPHILNANELDIAKKPDLAWEKIIKVKKGEQIAPLQLRSGAYYARANFYSADSVLLYRGDEKFDLASGEKKSIKIRLKKVDSGEITVGFEFDKPDARPSRISSDSHLELRKTAGFAVSKRYLDKSIDLDLANGVAITSTKCAEGVRGICTSEVVTNKVNLTKTAIRKILAITDSVTFKDEQKVCLEPIEFISLILKKCADCEVGKQYKYSNVGCGTPTHSLLSQQFDEIWAAIHGLNVRMDTAAAHP
jgi:hypothetical protein